MISKKKKLAVTAIAVLLAMVLMLGGTLAYLTGESEVTSNQFSTNSNSVELKETTGGEYNVVPGTSEAKDPTVIATCTLDSYVFLEVNDVTYNLVGYTINADWELLFTESITDEEDEEVGTTYIYYQLLTGTASEKKLNVLVGDTVYYYSATTNEDMEAAGEEVSLTFKAYIIQAEIETEITEGDETVTYTNKTVDPMVAWEMLMGESTYTATSGEQTATVSESNGNYSLSSTLDLETYDGLASAEIPTNTLVDENAVEESSVSMELVVSQIGSD